MKNRSNIDGATLIGEVLMARLDDESGHMFVSSFVALDVDQS